MDADPTLKTDRLMLVPHGLGDFDAMMAMWTDPAVTRFLGGHPASEEDSRARLLRYAGSWALLGYGFWAIRRRGDGQYLGSAGYLDGRRTGVGSFGGDPEIGWSLAIAAQGQGYALEAVTAALGWGRGRFSRTVAMIHTDNAASVKVAARCGFGKFAHARYKDEPMGLWEHCFTAA
jgi:RimJ/RimL family protein N-acetyltransferase